MKKSELIEILEGISHNEEVFVEILGVEDIADIQEVQFTETQIKGGEIERQIRIIAVQ